VVAVVSTSEKREAVAIDVHSTKTKYVVTGSKLIGWHQTSVPR
jgi:hypothetical protein